MGGIFKTPRAPAPPDPNATAAAQAGYNEDAARMNFRMNAVNQSTPYGSLSYSRNPEYTSWLENAVAQDRADNAARGQVQNEDNARRMYAANNPYSEWTATQTLSPAEQQQLDLSNQAQTLYGQAGVAQLRALQGQIERPFTPTYSDREAATQALLSRLAPQFDRQRSTLEARLANQGIALGSQAWRSGMDDFARGQNDAYLGAVIQGGNEANSQLQRDLAVRNQPYAELAALMSGQQVQNPSFVNTPQTQMQAPDYMGAVGQNYAGQMAGYNARLAQQNAQIGALASLAGTASSAATMGLGGGFGFGRSGGMKAASPSNTWTGNVSYGMR